MNTLLRVLTAIVVIGAIGIWMALRGPVLGQVQPTNPHQKLQEKAKAAHTGDAQAIRDFTDEIFNQQAPFANAAESLKERVSRCELLFRQGVHEPIHEKQLEKVFNEHVRAFGAPSFWKTNQSQIKLLRGHRRQLFPSFVEPRGQNSRNVPEAMGPAEAAYIVMQLAANKNSNPEFQVEPQIWNERALARRRTGLMKKSALVITASGGVIASGMQSTVSPDLAAEAALEAGIQSEDSEITAAAHRMLDQMGFRR